MNASLPSCPGCGGALPADAACSCGLDPDLLRRVVAAADATAHRAARLAAEGRWQRAADTASTSLRLRRSDNDLAAFVLLTARLAGATGGPPTVPAPRPEKLPPTLGSYAQPLIHSLTALRSGARSADGNGPLEAAIEDARATWADLDWLDAPSTGLAGSGRVGRSLRRWSPTIAATVIGLVAVGVMVLGLPGWSNREPAPPHPATRSQATASDDAATKALVASLRRDVRRYMADLSMAGYRMDARIAMERGEWKKVATFLELGGSDEVDRLADSLTPSQLRAAYLAGLRASRAGDFATARELLGLASRAKTPATYYWDDAVYYFGRAAQRTDQPTLAAGAFRTLLVEQPDSGYAADARRQLDVLTAPARPPHQEVPRD